MTSEKTFQDYYEEAKTKPEFKTASTRWGKPNLLYVTLALKLRDEFSNPRVLVVGCADGNTIFPFTREGIQVTPVERDESNFETLDKRISDERAGKQILLCGAKLEPVEFLDFESGNQYHAVVDSAGLNLYNTREDFESIIRKMQALTMPNGYLLTTYYMSDPPRIPTTFEKSFGKTHNYASEEEFWNLFDEAVWEEELHAVKETWKFTEKGEWFRAGTLLAKKKRIKNGKA